MGPARRAVPVHGRVGYARVVPAARAFLVGLLTGVACVVVLILGHRLDGDQLLATLALPLAALAGAALFGTGTAGWRRRAVRGGLGAVLAALAGLAAVFFLAGRTDWFEWPDEHGGDVFLAILVALAAIPGGTAAAAATPARGLAIAGGFAVGLAVALRLIGTPGPGVLVLLALGTIVGALVSAAGRQNPRTA